MFRIDGPTTTASMPTPLAPAGTPGFFQHGGPSNPGAVPTIVSSDWLNALQMEIENVIVAAGLTLDKTNQAQLLAALNKNRRIKLTSALDVYVATTGNDSNTGLTIGAPFLTIQAAVNLIANGYELQGIVPTIHVADGVYAAGAYVSGFTLRGSIKILGNTATPQNCKVHLAAGGSCFTVGENAGLFLSGFAVEAPAGSQGQIWTVPGIGIQAQNNGICWFDHLAFGACTYAHISAGNGGTAVVPVANTPYSIYGNTLYHAVVGTGSSTISIASTVVTVSNAVSINTFIVADSSGLIYAPLVQWTGFANVTGTKYLASNGGYIANGGGVNYFPGTLGGSSLTGYYS